MGGSLCYRAHSPIHFTRRFHAICHSDRFSEYRSVKFLLVENKLQVQLLKQSRPTWLYSYSNKVGLHGCIDTEATTKYSYSYERQRPISSDKKYLKRDISAMAKGIHLFRTSNGTFFTHCESCTPAEFSLVSLSPKS